MMYIDQDEFDEENKKNMKSPNAKLNAREWVLMHYDVNIHTEWKEFSDYVYTIEPYFTADGYDVYVAKWANESILIEENVFYYDHDFEQLLADMLPNFDRGDKIYISEDCLDLDTCEWEEWKQQIQEEEYE